MQVLRLRAYVGAFLTCLWCLFLGGLDCTSPRWRRKACGGSRQERRRPALLYPWLRSTRARRRRRLGTKYHQVCGRLDRGTLPPPALIHIFSQIGWASPQRRQHTAPPLMEALYLATRHRSCTERCERMASFFWPSSAWHFPGVHHSFSKCCHTHTTSPSSGTSPCFRWTPRTTRACFARPWA